MPDVTYEIVEHDGGWAYKVNGVFSEPFPTHAEALAAAQLAAGEQEVPGHEETIEYEDDKGKWHTENASGRDRPHTIVSPTGSACARRQFALPGNAIALLTKLSSFWRTGQKFKTNHDKKT